MTDRELCFLKEPVRVDWDTGFMQIYVSQLPALHLSQCKRIAKLLVEFATSDTYDDTCCKLDIFVRGLKDQWRRASADYVRCELPPVSNCSYSTSTLKEKNRLMRERKKEVKAFESKKRYLLLECKQTKTAYERAVKIQQLFIDVKSNTQKGK